MDGQVDAGAGGVVAAPLGVSAGLGGGEGQVGGGRGCGGGGTAVVLRPVVRRRVRPGGLRAVVMVGLANIEVECSVR